MATTIEELREWNDDIKKLKAFSSGGAKRIPNGNMDKVATGFNRDDRFAMCGKHTLTYDTKIGYSGDSGCTTQISLHGNTDKLFWRNFDAYLNEHQDEILMGVAKKMEKEMAREIAVVEERIKTLNAFMTELQGINDETI